MVWVASLLLLLCLPSKLGDKEGSVHILTTKPPNIERGASIPACGLLDPSMKKSDTLIMMVDSRDVSVKSKDRIGWVYNTMQAAMMYAANHSYDFCPTQVVFGKDEEIINSRTFSAADVKTCHTADGAIQPFCFCRLVAVGAALDAGYKWVVMVDSDVIFASMESLQTFLHRAKKIAGSHNTSKMQAWCNLRVLCDSQ